MTTMLVDEDAAAITGSFSSDNRNVFQKRDAPVANTEAGFLDSSALRNDAFGSGNKILNGRKGHVWPDAGNAVVLGSSESHVSNKGTITAAPAAAIASSGSNSSVFKSGKVAGGDVAICGNTSNLVNTGLIKGFDVADFDSNDFII